MSIVVRTWMKHPVHAVKLRDSVAHAREVLEQHRVKQLLVMHNGTLEGIVTDRDVRDASPNVGQEFGGGRRGHRLSADADPARIPVEDVMTRDVVTVAPDAPIVEAARLMRRERIGSLPVIEGGKVVGIITRSDLLDALIAIDGDA